MTNQFDIEANLDAAFPAHGGLVELTEVQIAAVAGGGGGIRVGSDGANNITDQHHLA